MSGLGECNFSVPLSGILLNNCTFHLQRNAMVSLNSCFRIAVFFSVILFSVTGLKAQRDGRTPLFGRQNLVAWCVVPFDNQKRNPQQRSEMLNDLKIPRLAYDWRTEHIPQFDDEIDALKSHHIQLQSFWLHAGHDVRTDKNVETVFTFLEKRKLKTQIWLMWTANKEFEQLTQEQKVDTAANAVRYIAKRAAAIGCTVGLYNHNEWFGEPDNQLAIIEKLKMKNLGIVYNFNHAQDQIEKFPEFFPRILPHLIALNLAGLKKGDQHIYPIGEGDSEEEMIAVVSKSAYRGPIGIINEDTDPDAKVGLQMNMAGLRKILAHLGDERALKTYD